MSTDTPEGTTSQRMLSIFLIGLQLFWLVLMLLLLGYNIWSDRDNFDRLVQREAQLRLQTSNNIRRWIVGFGGVYAPVTDAHQPNPLIPEGAGRDVETIDGRKLTIANSISALNQIIGKDNRVVGGFVRFTGDEALKAENAPDPWERAALQRLRAGEQMVADYTELEGKPYYRMIQPLPLKPKCYKCHEYKSFKLGDIIGGLEINVDLEVYSKLKADKQANQIITYGVLWLIGMLGITFGGRRWSCFLKERDKLHKQLQELATHDQLTGFLNRHQLDYLFNSEMARARREKQPLSVMMVDIDNFKDINDTHGHPVGDMVLRELAQVVAEVMRGSDLIFRFGGDELLFVLPDTSHEQLIKKAESLRALVAEFSCKTSEGATIAVTLSIGAATFPEHGDSQKALIESADNAVYLAKDAGRDQVRSASEAATGK